MNTFYLLFLLVATLSTTSTYAKTTSLRGKRQVNLPSKTSTANQLQGVIDAILEQQQAEEPTVDRLDAMYTIDDLELAEESFRNFIESKGEPVAENDSPTERTEDELKIAEQGAKAFLSTKGKHLSNGQERMHDEKDLEAAATSAEHFVSSKRPHSQLRSRQAKEPATRIAKVQNMSRESVTLKSSEAEETERG